jgi:hypothetical protein
MLLWLVACGGEDVTAEYAARRAEALEEAGPAPRRWKPDAALRLSEELVVQAIDASLDAEGEDPGAFEVEGIGKVTPKFEAKKVTLTEPACDDCIGLATKLVGTAKVKLGPVKKEFTWKADLAAQLAFSTTESQGAQRMQARLTQIDKLKVVLEGTKLDLSGPLERWGEQIVAEAPALDLGETGGADLGLRDLRVLPDEGGGVLIELLTDAAHPGELPAMNKPPRSGFHVLLSEATLLDLARREAFAHGALDYGLYVEPTSLTLDQQRFEMGLRIWNLDDAGWWREYTVKGDLSLGTRQIELAASELVPGDNSPGAVAIDALALLAEPFLLDEVAAAAQAAVPSQDRITAGDIGLSGKVTRAYGASGRLVIECSGEVSQAGKKGKK